MFKKFVVCSLLIVIVLIASGCGTGNGSEHLGRWESVDNGYVEAISAFTIIERGDHYVFELDFAGESSAQYPATYEDGYFTIQMPGYTWSAFYDDGAGHLIMNGQPFRKAN